MTHDLRFPSCDYDEDVQFSSQGGEELVFCPQPDGSLVVGVAYDCGCATISFHLSAEQVVDLKASLP